MGGGAVLLSVVVPCFRAADVLAQTHRRLLEVLGPREGIALEIVYVDDGSTTPRLASSTRSPTRTIASWC